MMQIDVARDQGVLEITLRNPKVNAIGVALSRQLGEAFLDFMANDQDHVAILSGGSGPVFSAGWDMKAAVAAGEGETSDYGPGGFAGLTEMFALTKPVIAAVNGIAVGGGVELILACDLIVAADTASFRLPETALGVLADAGGVQRLPRRLPYHIAMELLLTGRPMPAREAAQFGPRQLGRARRPGHGQGPRGRARARRTRAACRACRQGSGPGHPASVGKGGIRAHEEP